jgi:hypothetical protein
MRGNRRLSGPGIFGSTALAMILLTVSMTSQSVFAAGGTGGSQYFSACKLLATADASMALRQPVTSENQYKVAGFSQCVFASKSGLAVLVYVASNAMLTSYHHSTFTAKQEYANVKNHGFPMELRWINGVYFAPDYSLLDRKDGVVILDTFVFVHGHAKIPNKIDRLSVMLIPVYRAI